MRTGRPVRLPPRPRFSAAGRCPPRRSPEQRTNHSDGCRRAWLSLPGIVCETTGLAGSREAWWPASAGEVDWLREAARMPQAARVVSRVFLDGVASVVSGTAALELGSVTSRSRPVRIVASALFLLSVEHKQKKAPLFSSQPGLDEARAETRWTPAAARARIKRAFEFRGAHMHGKLKLRHPTASRPLVVASTILLVLAGCQESGEVGASQEMAWARVALERNPGLELIATDTDEGVFTVRDRRTGQVHAVRLDDIAAAPIAVLTATGPETDADAPADQVAPEIPVEDVLDETAQLTDAEPSVAALDTAAEAQDYTIERAEGRVRVTGPGVSIVSAGSTEPVSAKGEPGQRAVDPIVCDGPRTMRFDGRSIYVDGDAITVSGGCALYITNSRIVASATGVVVRGGVVHIDNSYVEGGTASFDVGSDARIYLRGSTFQGLMRRDAVAMIEDQGGNRGLPTL